MSAPLSTEQNQEVTLPSSRLLFGKLTWGRMVFDTSDSLWNNLPGSLKKKPTVLNTFKHNQKKKYLDNLAEARVYRIIIGIYLYS